MSIQLLSLYGMPIAEQLQLEQTLLRTSSENYCLINHGSPPAIVLGISGKIPELVDEKKAQDLGVPLLRRFSGGGTVVIDEDTIFVTFIFQKDAHSFPSFPEPIMRWSGTIYDSLFSQPLIALKENDYVIQEKKCGGNAQYIKRDRWLHHTSFLWDYKPHLMDCLLHPKKTPSYRENRSHADFLCRLSDHLESKEIFINALKDRLARSFSVQEISNSSLCLEGR